MINSDRTLHRRTQLVVVVVIITFAMFTGV